MVQQVWCNNGLVQLQVGCIVQYDGGEFKVVVVVDEGIEVFGVIEIDYMCFDFIEKGVVVEQGEDCVDVGEYVVVEGLEVDVDIV